jgi:hypothetical protein
MSKRLTEKQELQEKAAAEKRRVMEYILKCGDFTDDERELIFDINMNVMGVDGTAEGWGGYHYEPTDYVGTSIEIFKLTKNFFIKTSTIMQNQIQMSFDNQKIPDGCGIIIEFFDVPNQMPGPDSGNAADVADARIKSVVFVRDSGELHHPQMIEIRFNESGQIEVKEKQGGFIDVQINAQSWAESMFVQSFKIK